MKNTRKALAHLLGASALALIGTIVLPATSAHADASIDRAELQGYGGTYHSQSGCTTTNGGHDSVRALVPGKTVTHTFSDTSAVVNAGGARTEVTQNTVGRGSYTADRGRLRSFRLDASGGVGVQAGAGQTCGVSTWVTTEQRVDFTIDRPQWVSMSTDTSSATSIWVDGSNADYTTEFGTDGTTIGGKQSGTWLLPAGTYWLKAGISWERYTADGTPLPKPVRSGSGSVRVELRDAGGALGSASGSGKTYVTLGGLVSCADRRLPVAFRTNAKRVKSATFYVNGKKTRVIRSPKAGQTSYVPGLPVTSKATVQAKVVVDPPGSKKSAVVKVKRTYRACATR